MKEYGVFLNIYPAQTGKRVIIHRLPCKYCRQHGRSLGRKEVYTFHKDCRTFTEAIKKASDWALDWHAPIKLCKDCLVNWQLP